MNDAPANCGRKHERSESNTYRYGSRRECIQCRRYWWRMYSRRKRHTPVSNWQIRTEPEEIMAVMNSAAVI